MEEGILFERGNFEAVRLTRRRGITTSYGNRKPNQFASLTVGAASTKTGGLPNNLSSAQQIDIASGKTLLLSNPSDFPVSIHTTPVMGQNKLLASHKNNTRNNVANFIKDHNLGNRNMQKNSSKMTTAMESLVPA